MTALPPGPRLHPVLQSVLFVTAPQRFIARNRRRYGDVVTYRMPGGYTWVLLSDPRAIKEVFTAPPDVMYAGEANRLLGPILGQRSLLLLDGDEHLRHRRLLLPPFHGRRMRAYEAIMREAADRVIDGWPVGRPFALMPSMQDLTLEVIMRAVFGVRAEQSARAAELHRAIRAMIQPVSRRLGVLILALSGGRLRRRGPVRRFVERRDAAYRLLAEEVAARRAAPDLEEREDVFSMLLLARDQEDEALTDEEVRDELMTLLVAGHETTATALAWTFERLLRTPGVLAELKRSLAAGETDYADAVVKESLRLRAIIPSVGRILKADYPVAGYSLPAGIEVSPGISATHLRPEDYPEPRAFRPERFLGDSPPDTYTWLPFGGGPRRCLGAAFALFEMRIVLETVVRRTRLEPVGRAEGLSRRGITIVPARGGRVVQPRPPRPRAGGEPAAAGERRSSGVPEGHVRA